MNALVKKEIRLLLPSWIVALLLALVQAITRPYDFYVASLLFFGLTIMALTTIGREASLNTFSSLLAQPAARIQIWKTKLSVLAVAFLIVFVVWLAAFGIAFVNSSVDASDREISYNLFITVCLIATATFTGGLWTTLLLRQLAGAFWLTLLVPATLSGFSGVFLAESESSSLVIAVLSVVIGVYSIAGFFFARWLFFRAQDVGWSGGVIAMPEWKFLTSRAGNAVSARNRKPIFALIKKELQLQQVSLMGAAGLLVLHAGTIVVRAVHHFDERSSGASAGAIFVALFWILWLVMAPVIGSMSVAEERRLGVMEGQLCQPVSRRIQFVIKVFLTLVLGIILGGVVPVVLEKIGGEVGGGQSAFTQPANGYLGLGIVAFAAWLALVSFFASTLAKSFLQAVGFGIAAFFGCVLMVPLFTNGRMLFLDSLPAPAILPLLIAVPTIIVTLLWLAYLNFNHFRDDWRLWRRNLGGIAGALLLIFISSNVLYHRAWEVFEPAEPAHGPAKLSLANPPQLNNEAYENLLVRLPGGRVWFDFLSSRLPPGQQFRWRNFGYFINPLPRSAGPQKFLAGSNWVCATARHVAEQVETSEPGSRGFVFLSGYAESVGVQSDGTLWVSGKSDPLNWTADTLSRFGVETNWRQVVRVYGLASVLLLKRDGTLWRWGTNHFDLRGWPQNWPGLRAFQPYQIGTDSDWAGIYSLNGELARKVDGSVWRVVGRTRNGQDELIRATNYDQIVTQNCSKSGFGNWGAYVRADGTLWLFGQLHGSGAGQPEFEVLQSGRETNWVSASRNWDWLVAIKSDGTLWQWQTDYRDTLAGDFTSPPTRLGIHHDWLAVVGVEGGIVALAADGSLWFWPNPRYYEYSQILIRLPKQPQFLGNVFNQAN